MQIHPGASSRLLAVLRHAKAEPDAATDIERVLTERGRADATEAGAWLAANGLEPDHVLVSGAARTRETWACVADGAGWSVEPAYDEGLYTAGPDTALDLVRLAPDEAHTLLVVGHNPTMASLAQLLDDGEGDPELAAEMAAGYPTSAVAVFAYDGPWADLAEGTARLVGFHVGRG